MELGEQLGEREFLRLFREATGVTAAKRGYTERKALFAKFPRDVEWQEAWLTNREWEQVSLIRAEPNWLALGGFLREPLVAAHWSNTHTQFLDATRRYHRLMLQGKFPRFPVFLVGPPMPSPGELVCLDGNHRIIAGCMGGVDMIQLPALIGTSSTMYRWYHYRDPKKWQLTTLRVDL